MKFLSKVIFSFLPLPLWYPFSPKNLKSYEIKQTNFFSNPFIMYRDKNDSVIIHSNICPHQGGLFSNGGYVNHECNIVCPYHGFTYDNGSFIGIQNQDYFRGRKFKKKQELKTWKVREEDGMFFITDDKNNIDNIYYPPEHYQPSFRFVAGHRILNNNYLTVTENLLDMLHISFVHSFGSENEIPYNIKFEKLSDIHGKTTFQYRPSRKSLGKLLSRKDEKENFIVYVENEYILPTTTITRVFIQNSVKTVFTQSIPVDDNKTILCWRLYRNFWRGNYIIDKTGDFFVKNLMEKIIEEDVKILKNVQAKHRNGIVKTKYDKTILEFRKSMKQFLN